MRPLLIAILALATTATSASAATVSMKRVVEHDEGFTAVYGTVAIAAASGEANTLALEHAARTKGSTYALIVTDTTAPLTAGRRCQQVDPNSVRCQDPRVPSIDVVNVKLGDGADAFATKGAQSAELFVTGGPGDDTLTGRRADLSGNAGNDTLSGTGSDDTMDGGSGDDTLDGNGGADSLDGGPGDALVRGGPGHDNLLGGATIDDPAGAGRDRLEGGSGNDSMTDEDELVKSTEIGPDTLIGGRGIDSV